MIKSEVDFLEMVYFVTLALQKSASMIDLLHKLGFKSIFHLAKSVQFADCPVVLQEGRSYLHNKDRSNGTEVWFIESDSKQYKKETKITDLLLVFIRKHR